MKKGFTLVEIILSIGLMVLIISVSLVSFNLIKNNDKEKTLENMSDEILTAVNVYVETNEEVKKQIYNEKNSVKIPLITLENAGLVDFGDLSDDLDDEDFVVTMLGDQEEGADHCASTYTAKSWNIKSGETIYICEKDNGGEDGDYLYETNLSKATRTRYYYRGTNPDNYVKLEGTDIQYRILYIDKDDSLVLYNSDSFGDVFDIEDTETLSTTRRISIVDGCTQADCRKRKKTGADRKYVYCASATNQSPQNYLEQRDNISIDGYGLADAVSERKGETYIGVTDVINSISCGGSSSSSNSFMNTFVATHSASVNSLTENVLKLPNCYILYSDTYYDSSETFNARWLVYCGTGYVNDTNNEYEGYKIRLKSCFKITTGSGTSDDPFILKNTCS